MLLEWAEIDFQVMVSDVDETFNLELSPAEIAMSIAERKNKAIQERLGDLFEDKILIAADTIVVMEDEIIGKPSDRDNAIEILKRLSGKTHQVITAVDMRSMNHTECFYDTTLVRFHTIELSDIIHYVDQYKPFDKAGAYAIQEWVGVIGIDSIQGDFYNVMGLPISKVVNKLKTTFLQ